MNLDTLDAVQLEQLLDNKINYLEEVEDLHNQKAAIELRILSLQSQDEIEDDIDQIIRYLEIIKG